MRRGRSLFWLSALLLAAALPFAVDGPDDRQADRPDTPRLNALLGGPPDADETRTTDETEGYARALAPRPFTFPRDHGPHPRYRNEWWYFTGNLYTRDGRRFGYQLVIFRFALRPQRAQRASRWGTNQVYMAHFAVTDADAGRFLAYERFARGAAGLAGARATPFRLWLEDWSVAAGDDGNTWRVRAAAGGTRIDLRLKPAKAVVMHGDEGLSRKGAAEGNASYYYSITRIETHGTITLAGRRHNVRGQSWFDREWGTSALAADQEGWDWFALQLDDGSELMYYRLRRADGTIAPFSGGTWVGPSGRTTPLHPDDVDIEILDSWKSPLGDTYPSHWRMSLPGKDLALEIQPVMNDQELDLSVRYWEGAVDVSGGRGGRPVSGHGYVELVGYGE